MSIESRKSDTLDGDKLMPDGINLTYNGPTTEVAFRALEARKEGRQIILTLATGRSLTDSERETLKRLFPTLETQAYGLLIKEAVLSCIDEAVLSCIDFD